MFQITCDGVLKALIMFERTSDEVLKMKLCLKVK